MMSDQLRESLSALMDGEADELELRRLLSEASLSHVDMVDKTWVSYQLVREVIQGGEQGLSPQDRAYKHLDISRSVGAAIRNETQATRTDRPAMSALLKPLAGFAVAASVAVAVVLGVQSVAPVNSGMDATANTQPALASRVYPVQGASLQASAGGSAVSYPSTEMPGGIALSRSAADIEAKKRLEKYLLRHTEHAALNNGQGLIPYARVANFEVE
jgi:sigma-E factor negative regulatory protein RseA